MKVRELIRKLKEYDKDCQVLVRVKDDDIYNHVELSTYSRSNPIIDVAKESMLAFAKVPTINQATGEISHNWDNDKTITIGLSHDEVINHIIKANERTMKRNLEKN